MLKKLLIAGAVGLVIGIGAIKGLEAYGEWQLWQNFEREAHSLREKQGVETQLGALSLSLLGQTLSFENLVFHEDDEEMKGDFRIAQGRIEGLHIMDVIRTPDAIRSEQMTFNNLDFKVKGKKKEATNIAGGVKEVQISGANFAELGRQFKEADFKDAAVLEAYIDGFKAKEIVLKEVYVDELSDQAVFKVARIDVGNVFLGTFEKAFLQDAQLILKGKPAFHVASATYKGSNFFHNIALDVEQVIEKMTIHLPQEKNDKPFVKALAEKGITSLVLNLEGVSSWDMAAREMSFKKMDLAMEKLGRFNLTATMSAMPDEQTVEKLIALEPEAFSETKTLPEPFTQALQEIALKDMSLVYEDQNLRTILLDRAAAKQGVSKDQLVGFYILMTHGILQKFLEPAPAENLHSAISGFLSEGGRLHLSVHAKNDTPLNLASAFPVMILMPKAVLAQLDITATHSR